MVKHFISLIYLFEKLVAKSANSILKTTYNLEQFLSRFKKNEVLALPPPSEIEEKEKDKPYDRSVIPYELKKRIGFLDGDSNINN